MRQIYLSLVLALFLQFGQAAVGIFEAGITVDGVTYVENSFSFQGKAFSVTEGDPFELSYAFAKTFKNGGDNVCGATLHYAVYPASGSPTFTSVPLDFAFNIGGSGDQQWDKSSLGIDLAAGLPVGFYKIAVYYSATGHGPGGDCNNTFSVFLSNGGNNFVADLTVEFVAAVDVSRFEASSQGHGKVAIRWETSSEWQHDYFELWRSSDQANWQLVATIDGSGTSNRNQTYTFIDQFDAAGTVYYRLVDIDYGGARNASNIISVSINAEAEGPVVAYPNPANERLYLINMPSSDINVFNALGQLMGQYKYDLSLDIDVSNWANGLYIIECAGETFHFEVKH